MRSTPTPGGAPRFATKRFIWSDALGDWRRIAYEAGAQFTAEERPVEGLEALGAALEEIHRDPTAFVVRGELLPDAREALTLNPRQKFRRAKKVSRKGQAPTLAERPIRQLMIDVDGYPLKDSDDLAADPENVVERAIRDLLPEPFHDAACFWQLSASAGFTPGVLKTHLWFWLDLEAVKLANSAGESVERAVCGGGKEGAAACPLIGKCGYYRQAAAVSRADVVLAAHEAAFHLPSGAKKNVGLVIMDESFWQDGLLTGRTIGVEGLADNVLFHPVLRHVPGGRQVQDDEGTADLHEYRALLEKALASAPEGYLRRDALEKAGLTVAKCAAARGLEFNRKRMNLMRPGMPAEDRKKAAEESGVNAQILRFAAMWTIMADLLAGTADATGRAEMLWKPDREGNKRWTLSLNTISEMAKTVAEAPVLLLDATMPVELVRAYLPRLEAAPAIRVKAPHMEVRQVRGGWGKTTLLPGRMKVELDEDGGPKNLPLTLAELRDFVRGETRGERALVITYLDAENAFRGIPGVETAHFNDIAGRDEWGPKPDRDVREQRAGGSGA